MEAERDKFKEQVADLEGNNNEAFEEQDKKSNRRIRRSSNHKAKLKSQRRIGCKGEHVKPHGTVDHICKHRVLNRQEQPSIKHPDSYAIPIIQAADVLRTYSNGDHSHKIILPTLSLRRLLNPHSP